MNDRAGEKLLADLATGMDKIFGPRLCEECDELATARSNYTLCDQHAHEYTARMKRADAEDREYE